MKKISVKVYSTTWCPYCKMAKQYFTENKIPFEEINVAEDQEKLDEMAKKSGQQGVPVIDINGRIIVGYNLPAIKQALRAGV